MRTIGHWVDGKPWAGASDRRAPVYDPATGQVHAEVALASANDVGEVVAAASRAAESWGEVPLARRAAVLFELRTIIQAHRADLARAITTEHGKVLEDASGEISRGLEVIEFACGVPHLLKGSHSQQVSAGVDTWSIRRPLGVVAGITPFNFPAMVPLWMAPLALACGNAFVLKPSERDPSASLLLAEWLAQAGLHDGVFSVVQGDGEAVDALLAHPDVAAVSFVGSTPVARHVYERAAAHGKRVQALAGAKNHMVVLADADLDAAADAAVAAGFGSAGERCMAISVVVAVEAIADDLVARIAARTERIVVGDGRDADVQMGPLITESHARRVTDYVDAGVADGAELVVDGRGCAVDGRPGGFWLGPCLFDHVATAQSIYRDEIFGPVLSVVRVASLDDALELIAANPWGNGVALFTRDGGAARRFQRQVDVGMVGINVALPVPVAYYSFGGWKGSLFGDAHVYGTDAVRFYTRTQVVTGRWPDVAAGASSDAGSDASPHAGQEDRRGGGPGPDLHFPSGS